MPPQWQIGVVMKQHGPHDIVEGLIKPLGFAILLRGARGREFMVNFMLSKPFIERYVHILPTSVSVKLTSVVASGTLPQLNEANDGVLGLILVLEQHHVSKVSEVIHEGEHIPGPTQGGHGIRTADVRVQNLHGASGHICFGSEWGTVVLGHDTNLAMPRSTSHGSRQDVDARYLTGLNQVRQAASADMAQALMPELRCLWISGTVGMSNKCTCIVPIRHGFETLLDIEGFMAISGAGGIRVRGDSPVHVVECAIIGAV
jgi:hypothetical protein